MRHPSAAQSQSARARRSLRRSRPDRKSSPDYWSAGALLRAEVLQDLSADPVFAQVGRKAELYVCLNGIEALFLQLIRLQLVDQTDAAAFLAHIEQHATAFLVDLLHGCRQLLTAVAPAGTEHVAGQALGVYAAEQVLAIGRSRP